ncbi:MAG: hypothetical protein ACI4VU_08200 [Methanobrevibacter sp.]
MSLSKDLKNFILSKGANDVGFANLEDMDVNDVNGESLDFKIKSGISFFIHIMPEVVNGLSNGPTGDYLKEYGIINEKLDSIAVDVEKYLKSLGYNAYAQTVSRTGYNVVCSNACKNTLPYKTVATKAGLGWIGKCAMFVNKNYGSALRLSSVLSDAPLEYGKPVTKSFCGSKCVECRDACYGSAVSGLKWSPDLEREDFFDYEKCLKGAKKISLKNLDKELTICGKCMYVCPHTQKYLRKALK